MPWDYREEEPVAKIARKYFSSLIEVDKKSLDKSRWTRDVKAFVNVTVADPLIPYFYLKVKNVPEQRVKFRYESLMEVCIFCGRIGHEIADCQGRKTAMMHGHDGEPTGEYRNLNYKPLDGPMSDDESEEHQEEPEWEKINQGWEGSESSEGSFSTPSLNSPAGFARFDPSYTGSGSSQRRREPLYIDPTSITPKFHHFFPDGPTGVNSPSPIRRINLTATFDQERVHTSSYNQGGISQRPGKAIQMGDGHDKDISDKEGPKRFLGLLRAYEPI
ncbi:hypothetical protein LINGRAHAP2_LOCUS5183 [Linum grandiflorum]